MAGKTRKARADKKSREDNKAETGRKRKPVRSTKMMNNIVDHIISQYEWYRMSRVGADTK